MKSGTVFLTVPDLRCLEFYKIVRWTAFWLKQRKPKNILKEHKKSTKNQVLIKNRQVNV